MRLVDVAGGAVTIFQTPAAQPGAHAAGPSVPGAFTPEGWSVVKERIEKMTTDREHDANAWVLAAPRARAGRRRGDAAGANTFAATSTPGRLSCSRCRSASRAASTTPAVSIKALITQKPLDAVWRNAGKDLIFKDDSPAGAVLAKAKGSLSNGSDDAKKKLLGGDDDAAAAAAGKPPPRQVGRRARVSRGRRAASSPVFLGFGLTKPTGTDAYGQLLGDLAAALGEPGAPAPDPAAFQAALKTARSKLEGPHRQLQRPQLGRRASSARCCMPPLSGTEVAVGGATGDSANHKWCENVVVVFDQLLAGKYPFSSSKHAHEAPGRRHRQGLPAEDRRALAVLRWLRCRRTSTTPPAPTSSTSRTSRA